MENEYVVAGRISDGENDHRLVVARSSEEAESIFEKWLREQIGNDTDDVYIDHCQTITDMRKCAIK